MEFHADTINDSDEDDQLHSEIIPIARVKGHCSGALNWVKSINTGIITTHHKRESLQIYEISPEQQEGSRVHRHQETRLQGSLWRYFCSQVFSSSILSRYHGLKRLIGNIALCTS